MAKAKKAKTKAKKPAARKSKTAQKPLATGDVSPFPAHAFRTDLGESLPPQTPPAK
jgi:hypothetical protein